MIKKLSLLILLFSQVLSAQQTKTQLSWPGITRENKPWSRWWWPGSIVNPSDLTANMEKYQKAGLGGMEVTVIYGVKGLEDKFIKYLSPEWMDKFTYTLKEGERLDMGIELANASGWPFGGPWVEPEDACRNINYKTWNLKTGENLSELISFIQKPLVRAIGLKPDITRLADPISKNDSLQIYALDQIRFARNQSHGAPANILDLYAATDIPETEGAEITKFKFASSAGNVTGKKFVSSESATWLNEHFSSTLSDVKKAVDLFFIAGVNHIYYHGTCYSPVNQPWPGFQFYASVEFSPQNSFWNDFEGLNKYVAHVQSFLQKGNPDNDILLYFPIFDRYSDYGRDLLEHFSAISPRFNGTPFKTAADDMLNKGYTYDYISDLQLKKTQTVNGLLQTTGGTYKTLIVPGCKYIPLETFEKVLKLAEEGGQVIFYGDMPENIAGLADYLKKSETYSKLKAGLRFASTENKDVQKTVYGKGNVFLGNDLEQLLSDVAINRETMVDNSIKFNRRKYVNGYYYFVVNKGTTPFEGWLPLGKKASSAALFNPMTGDLGISNIRIGSDSLTEIYVHLKPEESFIIETFNTQTSGKKYNFYEPVSTPQMITGLWKVEFIEGGPVLPGIKEIDKLVSWTEFGGEQVKDFSGTVKYSINFKKPDGKAEEWTINLGKVCESARVSLNGKELAILIGPDYQVIINNELFKANNTLEIKVSNLAINRIAYADRNNIPWKIFYNINMSGRLPQSTKNGIFDASDLKPRESGLVGPVTITEMKKVI